MSNDQPDGISIIRVEECDEEQFIRLLFHCWFGKWWDDPADHDEHRDSCLRDLLYVGLQLELERITATMCELIRARILLSQYILAALVEMEHLGLRQEKTAADYAIAAFQSVLQQLRSTQSVQQYGYVTDSMERHALLFLLRFLRQHPSTGPLAGYFLPFHGFYLAFDQRTGGLLGCMSCAPVHRELSDSDEPAVSATFSYVRDPQVAALLIIEIEVRFLGYRKCSQYTHVLDHSQNEAGLKAATDAGFVPSARLPKSDGPEFSLP